MKKKFFVFSLCLYTACILSGCSPLSRKPSTSDVESFAKTHINDSVEPTGQKYSEHNIYGSV